MHSLQSIVEAVHMDSEQIYDHLSGVLLGTAVGDALGLFMEGLSARTIASWFASDINRYYLLGNTGFVSDDTEQSALVAQSIIRYPDDCAKCTRAFQMSMLGWFCRMPFGVGRATSFACLRMLVGSRKTGICSAGNGAAMRAAIIGLFFHDDQQRRLQFGTSLASATHVDPRAVDGALFVAEMAAAAYFNRQVADTDARYRCFDAAIKVVNDSSLRTVLMTARTLASQEVTIGDAGQRLGCSGFVNHSVPLSTFAFLRCGGDSLTALQCVIKAGGDTDTNAAIVGAWCGALYGELGLPQELVSKINDGPFGPRHLRELAKALAARKNGNEFVVPTYSWPLSLARNVALLPVIVSHALLRIGRSGTLRP
jgi:ADP-ribosyl-[dinitrogen reductase] hydrolase